MTKKIFSVLLCMVLTLAMGITVFADGPYLVNITRPEGSEESTFKRTYVICGNTDREGVTVELSVYDSSLGYYVPYYNTEGESSWVIGSSGMFMKEVSLPRYGANQIRIVAYMRSNPYNKQEERFTITLLKEDLKDKILDGVLRFNDSIINKVTNIFR